MKHLYATTAIILSAMPALAVTPAEALFASQEAMRISGMPLTYGEMEHQGNDIILHDLKMERDTDGFSIAITEDWVRLSNTGNGTVEITQSPLMLITVNDSRWYGDPRIVIVEFTSDYSTQASDSGDGIRFVTNMPLAEVRVDPDRVSGVPGLDEFSVGFTDVVFDYVQTSLPDDHLGLDGHFAIGSMLLSLQFTDSADPIMVQIDGSVGEMVRDVDVIVPLLPENGVRSPVEILGVTEVTFDTFDLQISSHGGPQGNGEFAVGIKSYDASEVVTEQSAGFNVKMTGVHVGASGGDLPVDELQVEAPTVTGSMVIPVGASDDVKDLGFMLQVDQFRVNDEMWDSFDPERSLPRDPANFLLDVSAKVRMFVDLMDLANENVSPPQDGSPVGELISVDLGALNVNLAGASLAGLGGVTFPMGGKLGDRDIPNPIGKLTFTLHGTEALIESLGHLPMIPPQISFSAMSAIGMLTRPAGEDTVESVVEFGPDFSITVNGVKMQ